MKVSLTVDYCQLASHIICVVIKRVVKASNVISQQYHGTIKLSFMLIVWFYSKVFGREIKPLSGLLKAEVDIFKAKLFAQVVL